MVPAADQPRITRILDFWFAAGTPEFDRPRDAWWTRDDAFDAELCRRFGADHERAARGALAAWLATPDGALALVLLLDQLSRNLYRGSPGAFATDPLARDVADEAIRRGHDKVLPTIRRQFLYVPFMHSEDCADQARCVRLFATLADLPSYDDSLRSARRHEEIIRRFGRFPHRNAVLGRATSPEEATFLQEPDSSF